MQNKINKLRTFLAVLLLVFSIFSVAYIALEKNHHCEGDDCPVCLVISIAEQNIKLLSFGAIFKASCNYFCIFKKSIFASVKNTYLKSNTLVSQKIRLND